MRYSLHLLCTLLSFPLPHVSAWTAFTSLFRRPVSELTATTRRPFISGNWKLNPQTRDEAVQLAQDIAAAIPATASDRDVALFVPYVFIESAMNAVDRKLMVGAEVGGTGGFECMAYCI
jgi:triosephosphate isomerase (TIM)